MPRGGSVRPRLRCDRLQYVLLTSLLPLSRMPMGNPKMLLPGAVTRLLRRGVSIIAVSVLITSVSLAVAQQYPPSTYPYPSQPPEYPGGAQPPAYPSQGYGGPGYGGPGYGGPGYGGPGAPPPPQQEVIPPPPGAAMVWQPGYWAWRRHGWVWVSGRYASSPYPHAAWAPGHWTDRHGRWVWVPGHWR
jgi:WXXGXW repeat (2 copies)